MSKTRKQYLPLVAFGIVGALLGFIYWKYVGCVSGTCPITSNWYATTGWGALMGVSLGDVVRDFKNKKKIKGEELNSSNLKS